MLNYTRVPVFGSGVGDGGGGDGGVVWVDKGDAETKGLTRRGDKRNDQF